MSGSNTIPPAPAASVPSHPSDRPKKTGLRILGLLISIFSFAAAAVLAMSVAENIRKNPRTEDAQVRANVIGVAPQVGGTITELHVKDNQLVHKGDLLFEIDSRPYAAEAEKAKAQLALTELEIQAYKDQIAAAEAQLKQSEAKAAYAVDYAKRVQALVGNLYVTVDKNQLAQTEAMTATDKVAQDRAALERARNLLGEQGDVNVRRVASQAALKDSELRLSYCKVYATCDGYVTNLQITPGAYAAVGEQIFSLVDRKIWYVLANFRETDLKRMRPGMSADVYLLAESGKKLHGIAQGRCRAEHTLQQCTRRRGVALKGLPHDRLYPPCPALSREDHHRRTGGTLLPDGRDGLGHRSHRQQCGGGVEGDRASAEGGGGPFCFPDGRCGTDPAQ